MKPIKNNRLDEFRILSTEVVNMEDNFKLFLTSIGCLEDENVFIYRIYYASLVNALFRDNCYYGSSLLNDMSDIDGYMVTVKELNLFPYVRNTYPKHDKNFILSRLEMVESFFIDGISRYYKKSFLEWLETVCLLVNDRIRFMEVMLYPVFMEWDMFNLHIGYTSDSKAFQKVILPTPELFTNFCRTYYENNFTETVPSNLVTLCLEELNSMIYNEPIDDIIKRIMNKTLESVELDKFDPVRSMYYINMNVEEFSRDLYLVILNLLSHFHSFITQLNLSDTSFYITDLNKKSLTINYREGSIK